jgi:hypothetical protein
VELLKGPSQFYKEKVPRTPKTASGPSGRHDSSELAIGNWAIERKRHSGTLPSIDFDVLILCNILLFTTLSFVLLYLSEPPLRSNDSASSPFWPGRLAGKHERTRVTFHHHRYSSTKLHEIESIHCSTLSSATRHGYPLFDSDQSCNPRDNRRP